jgi:hypothetical protein
MALRDTPEGRDQLAALLAAPPPRRVPPEVRKAALRQSYLRVIALFGTLFLFIGLAGLGVFFPWHFYQDRALLAADTATAPGRILSANQTSMSIGGNDDHRGTPVYSYDFEFSTSMQKAVRGTCYTTGARWKNGETVTVRFRPEQPTLACVTGARLSPSDDGGFFTLLFPLVGSGILYLCWRLRSNTLRLLESGQAAEATITAIEETRTKINNKTVYKITLRSDAVLSGRPLTARYYQPEIVAFAREHQASNQPVYVLFDPAKPKSCLLPEAF